MISLHIVGMTLTSYVSISRKKMRKTKLRTVGAIILAKVMHFASSKDKKMSLQHLRVTSESYMTYKKLIYVII